MDFEKLEKSLKNNLFEVSVFEKKEEATKYLNEKIDNVSIGFGGSVTVEELLARCITTLVKIHECEKVDDAFIAANGDLADRVELLRQNVVEVAHEMLALLQDVHRAINPITEKDFLGLAALAA